MTVEPPRQLSDGSVEGNIFGTSPSDNISFYGAAPTTQPTSPAQAAIADASGGVANPLTGVAAVPAAYNQAEIANAFATIIAGHNAIVNALVTLGLIKGA
jgi:hypothetical protein